MEIQRDLQPSMQKNEIMHQPLSGKRNHDGQTLVPRLDRNQRQLLARRIL